MFGFGDSERVSKLELDKRSLQLQIRGKQEFVEELTNANELLIEHNEALKQKLIELEQEFDRIKSIQNIENEPDKSLITFLFDKDLKVSTKTHISEDIKDSLLDNGYILDEQRDDESAISLAFIVMANEVTEQLISDINENAQIVKEFIEDVDNVQELDS